MTEVQVFAAWVALTSALVDGVVTVAEYNACLDVVKHAPRMK
jgi:hypothetical protein